MGTIGLAMLLMVAVAGCLRRASIGWAGARALVRCWR